MTDLTVPDVTDDERRLARKWAASIASRTETWTECTRAAARVILDAVPAPPRPTLADMTRGERRECQWMQCEVRGDRRAIILIRDDRDHNHAVTLDPYGHTAHCPFESVTPRPDLPRMEWPSDKKAEDVPPVKVGDVIESADDPRLEALPTGSVLLDRDGVTATKQREGWTGFGYVPIPTQGTEFGPWTVRRIGLVADQ